MIIETVAKKIEDLEKKVLREIDYMPDFIVLDLESFTALKDELGIDPITDSLETFHGYDILVKTFDDAGELIRFGKYI